LSHPFADFLPSFWAKGIFRALDILFSSVRFLFWRRFFSLRRCGWRLDFHQHPQFDSALWCNHGNVTRALIVERHAVCARQHRRIERQVTAAARRISGAWCRPCE